MADFCKHCSELMFGEDFGDAANISTPEDTTKGLYATMICESCGIIQVDHNGKCVHHSEEDHIKLFERGHKP